MTAISKIYITLTQYFMFIYQGCICIYLEDIKFLSSMLLLVQLYTGDTNDNNDDNDDDSNDTWQTNHDCIGSLACMSNEPKTVPSWPLLHVCVCVYVWVCVSVCVSLCACLGCNFWKNWHRKTSFLVWWYILTYLVQVWVSRSLGQGQGHLMENALFAT